MVAYSTFTLTGKHTTPGGVAHRGSVEIRPNTVMRDAAGKVILAGPESVPLDAAGAWSATLPCDGPGLNPASGIGYQIAYRLASAAVATQSFAALPELAGTTLDVSEITGSGAPTAPATVPTPGPAGPPGVVANAFLARTPDSLISGAITRDPTGAATTAPVTWPDGTPGTYTALVLSAAFPGAVDSYQITYGSPVTKTYTQPAITRDANGAAVTVPAITVV